MHDKGIKNLDDFVQYGSVAAGENGSACWHVVGGDCCSLVDVVPVSLGGSELDGETSRISSGVGGSGLSSDGGESSRGGDLVSNLGEEFRNAEIGNVVGDLEFSVRSRSLGVDDSLGDSLSVKVTGRRMELVAEHD